MKRPEQENQPQRIRSFEKLVGDDLSTHQQSVQLIADGELNFKPLTRQRILKLIQTADTNLENSTDSKDREAMKFLHAFREQSYQAAQLKTLIESYRQYQRLEFLSLLSLAGPDEHVAAVFEHITIGIVSNILTSLFFENLLGEQGIILNVLQVTLQVEYVVWATRWRNAHKDFSLTEPAKSILEHQQLDYVSELSLPHYGKIWPELQTKTQLQAAASLCNWLNRITPQNILPDDPLIQRFVVEFGKKIWQADLEDMKSRAKQVRRAARKLKKENKFKEKKEEARRKRDERVALQERLLEENRHNVLGYEGEEIDDDSQSSVEVDRISVNEKGEVYIHYANHNPSEKNVPKKTKK